MPRGRFFAKTRADQASHYRRPSDFVQVLSVHPDDELGPTYDVVRTADSQIIYGVRGGKAERYGVGNVAVMEYVGGSHYYPQLKGLAGGFTTGSILSEPPPASGLDEYVERGGDTLSGSLEGGVPDVIEVDFVNGVIIWGAAEASASLDQSDLVLSSVVAGAITLDTIRNHPVTVLSDGSAVGARAKINFIEGDGIIIVAEDDAGNERVNVTLEATLSGAAGSPGGENTHVQYNDSGSFGGQAQFTYDASTGQLFVQAVSNEVILVVRALQDQSSDLFEVQDSDGNELLGVSAAGKLTIADDLAVNGGQVVISKAGVANYIELGQTDGSNWAYIDLKGDTTYTDYGMRILRNNAGANAINAINCRGTGGLQINVEEAGSIRFYTTGTLRLTVAAGGGLTLEDAQDIACGTSTGNSFGSATNQKVGFHGSKAVQAAHIADPIATIASAVTAINAILVVLENKGLTASS